MRLLLAEDEKDLSKALCTILKYNNYSVDAVFNGQDAVEFIQTGIYDGVILDIMMPKVDGLSVLKIVRERGINVPILLLTAKSEIDDRCVGLDMGANDYLTKPFATKELISRIRAMIRRTEGKNDNILRCGNVTLCRATFTLSVGDKSIKLINKEFQMMEMFMLSPKNVISVEQFMTKIWGFDSEAEINVVWVYVSYLRKKLKKLNADIEIKSSRNVGYFLECT